MIQDKQLLTPNEASKMLNVSTKTLWRWAVKKHYIEYKRLPSGHLRYPKADIERIILGEKENFNERILADKSKEESTDFEKKVAEVRNFLGTKGIPPRILDRLEFHENGRKMIIKWKTPLKGYISKVYRAIKELGGKLEGNKFEIPLKN